MVIKSIFLLLVLTGLQQAIATNSLKTVLNEESMTQATITIETLRGDQTSLYLPALIELRLSFFRNYPYFYEGNVEEEKNYVRMYADSKDSLLSVAKKGEEVIAVIAGIPLLESQSENSKLFNSKDIPAASTFYIGEIVIAEKYQNDNLGHTLYQQFEKSIKELEKYDTLLVCEVERDDSKMKASSSTAEVDWEERGFTRQEELNAHYFWREIGETEKRDHLMAFWKKVLPL